MNSTVVATKSHVSCDLAGKAAILHLGSGVYYGLDAVGARCWELMQVPRTGNELVDTLVGEYEVERDRCERDVVSLLNELADEHLVEIVHAAGP